MNPFHVWLGLPEKSVNPNYYQLLGISSSEKDPEAIEQAACDQLARLDAVKPAKHNVDAFKKVRQRILKAHATLSNGQKRAEYDSRLRAKLKRKKQRAKLESESSVSDPLPSVNPPVSDQVPPAVTEPSPENRPTPGRPVSPTSNEIPLAVPMTRAISKEGDLNPNTDYAVTGEPPMATDISAAEIAVSTDKFQRRRKSRLIPIAGLVLCLAGIGGLAYVVVNYEFIARRSQPDSQSNVPEVPDVRTTTGETSNDAQVPPKADVDPTDTDPDRIPTDLSTQSKTPSDTPSADSAIRYEELDFPQLVTYRRHLGTALRALYRDDLETADNEIKNAQSLFSQFRNPDVALAEPQQWLPAFAESARVVRQLLEGFRRQVVTSALEISAGQPIEVGGKTLGFVEGTPESVILRIDGRNATIPYELMAPGIAIALAEQGAKDDVPTFRMQKAAFYAIHHQFDPKYRQRATELAEQAAADGHDPQPILDFVNYDWQSVGIPAEKAEQPPADEIQQAMPRFIVSMGLNDFRRLRPETAADAVQSVLDAAVAEQDTLRQAMSFELAYLLAVKSGDLRLVNDVLDEYNLWFNFNYQQRLDNALLDVAQQQLDGIQAQLLLTAMVHTAETVSDRQFKRKLVNQGKKVAQRHRLDELLGRLLAATESD